MAFYVFLIFWNDKENSSSVLLKLAFPVCQLFSMAILTKPYITGRNLAKVETWLYANKLSLNIGKENKEKIMFIIPSHR